MLKEFSSRSDAEVLSALDLHIKREREETEQIIRHLFEVESRQLVAGLGYRSLFDFLTKGRGYSESSAYRRIQAARAMRKLPEVFDCLKSGELTLSTVCALAPVLGKGKDREALESVRGKTFAQAKEAVAAFNPVAAKAVREKITTVVIAPAAADKQEQLGLGGPRNSEEKPIYFRSEAAPMAASSTAPQSVESTTLVSATPVSPAAPSAGPAPVKRHIINFSVDDEFMSLLTRAKELSSHAKLENLTLENVLRKALKTFVAQNCPKEREERRAARRKRVKGACGRVFTKKHGSRAGSKNGSRPGSMPGSKPGSNNTAYIPLPLRDAVLCRDGHQCSFVGADGTRCESRRKLQIDHINARKLGGETNIENLRTLCRAHNLHAARETFGKTDVETQIAFSKLIREGKLVRAGV